MSSIDGGVLVDMSRFNRLEYDAERQTVSIGTGLRWGEVHSFLEQYGVTVVGGRISDVGVGGLTLGSMMGSISSPGNLR
jgi:FAD/FMN-containing dehydrogenase